MPNLFNSLRECLGFSQIIRSTVFKISSALTLKSLRFPIGVEMIYKPFSKFFIITIFIFIVSCVPVNNTSKNIFVKNYPNEIKETNENSKESSIQNADSEEILKTKKKINIENVGSVKISNQVEILLPNLHNSKITKNLINALELAVYKNEINNVQLNINKYGDLKDLDFRMSKIAKPGKIFVGTLNSKEAKVVKNYCSKGILFFSFSGDKDLAGECAYLINFFPEDDLIALFNYFPTDSKIALLYPENFYGYQVNSIIDDIAKKSKSLIINRASYKEDLTNARHAIKELGKFELRKYELERQKIILKNKDDIVSKNALKKIKKFETLGEVDFTHIILPDYGIRLLEIAPLLPFYDVDPNKVQFVGTGVWDDRIFFNEPSLQNAIFSGIEFKKRRKFFEDYLYIYSEKPLRISTIPYDLVGILSYLLNKKFSLNEAYDFMNNNKIKFDGIDGKFYFENNLIVRELDILQINNGSTKKLN